jgi:hypothetical protein
LLLTDYVLSHFGGKACREKPANHFGRADSWGALCPVSDSGREASFSAIRGSRRAMVRRIAGMFAGCKSGVIPVTFPALFGVLESPSRIFLKDFEVTARL